MTPASGQKRREILRFFYSLIVVLVTAAGVFVVGTAAVEREQGERRDRLAFFHLRSSDFSAEAIYRVAELQLTVPQVAPGQPLGRDVEGSLFAIAENVHALEALHRTWRQPDDPYAGTIARIGRQLAALEDQASPEGLRTDDFGPQLQALKFSLVQLDRLHSMAAEDLLAQITHTEQRNSSLLGWATVIVFSVAAFLIGRILFLVRRRLVEHEQTEQSLIDRERQLQQSSKMEALGTLVGGVAHDFNNLLTAIFGNVETLQARLDPGHPSQHALQEIRKAAERAAALTRQLLAFSRKQPTDLHVIDLGLLVRDMEPLLRRLLPANVTLALRPDPDAGSVEVDPVQMEQVLLNLAVNARDAIEGPGAVTVTTSAVTLDGGGSTPPGEYVRLTVEDTGSGMSPETIARVFDPFFTTKEQGKGTGLGLSMVHGIVNKSGGHVAVYSRPGAGTRFEIDLPRCDGREKSEAGDASPASFAGRGETVLLAEDDSQVRQFAAAGLRQAGYRVLEADDGEEALRLAAEHGEPLRLIVSDVVMPGMRGPELVRRVLEIHPGIRVLFISGYSDDELLRGADGSEAPLLAKPFRLQQLLRMVRQELDATELERSRVDEPA